MPFEGGLTSDRLFLLIAVLLVAAGIGYAYVTAPTTLTVAVGPADSAETRLLQAFSNLLKKQRVALRLKIKPVPNVQEAATSIDDRSADLAIVRTDVRVPDNGLTVAVMREAAAVFMTPESSKIADLSGLGGKTVGVGLGHPSDPALISKVLKYVDLDEPAVKIVPMPRDDILPALKEKRIQAAAIVAPPTGATATAFVRRLADAFEGKLKILDLDSADGLSRSSPTLTSATIPAGIWGGRPKRPAEEVKTVSVGYRLMAHQDLDRNTVSLLAESLFQMRSRLAQVAPSANLMHAPDMDTASSATSAALPNHPGAVDYFQRETQTIMDRYGDWIYLLAFFGSGLISAAAAFRQRFVRQKHEQIDDVLDRLVEILAEARQADSLARLDELGTETDGLLASAVLHARRGSSGARAIPALVLALDGARAAIAERRRAFRQTAEPPIRHDGAPRLVTAS